MDFQFISSHGSTIVKCSMEHQALANWFNTEVRLNSQLISTALSLIQQARQQPNQDFPLVGAEYSLLINQDEVMVRANNLDIENSDQAIDDDFHYYDEESIAFCGLEDFEHFLLAYLDFIH